jgi:adenylate cyclase
MGLPQTTTGQFPAALFRVSGPDGVTEVTLLGGTSWKIGRDQSCAVVLKDDVVSRRHAMVQFTENAEYYLIDLGSRNGTFLNDGRVSVPSVLANGDQIRIGVYQLEFRCGPSVHKAEATGIGDDANVTRAQYAPRLVSVLVADVRGYTRLAQMIDHAVLCQLIGSWFREAGHIMEAHGSWALKYIGDAVMAVWLHDRPAVKRSQILRILQASAELARITAKLPERFELPIPFVIGAGMNTGMAMVGNTGTGSNTDFTALGEVVNAAFRIESCTRQIGHDMAIGRATWEALGEPSECFEERQVELKGYERKTSVWAASFAQVEVLLASAEPAAADSGGRR